MRLTGVVVGDRSGASAASNAPCGLIYLPWT